MRSLDKYILTATSSSSGSGSSSGDGGGGGGGSTSDGDFHKINWKMSATTKREPKTEN